MSRPVAVLAVSSLLFAGFLGCHGHEPTTATSASDAHETHHGDEHQGEPHHGDEHHAEPLGDEHAAGDEHASHAGHEGDHNPGNVKAHVDEVFGLLDADGDRIITREEAEGHRIAGKFDEVDANRDGAVSYDELTAFGTKMHGAETTPE